jgi:hypothetical protein
VSIDRFDAPARRDAFLRSLAHWRSAAERLADQDLVASPQAWQALEHYLGVSLRTALVASVQRLRRAVDQFERELRLGGIDDTAELQRRLVDIRQLYFRAETTVDFYSDCLATRSIPRLAALLRACDHIATRSMAEGLTPMGREVPAALTYLDKGLGASVLKAGLRLWDGTVENPVATIKVTRHNLLRCCSIIHEAGHQVAHMLGWVPELAEAFRTRLADSTVGVTYGAWASEIAADGYAHVHTGYGAAVALHDVLDASDGSVFQIIPGDPHPVSYVRVLMVMEMCRQTFGDGSWDLIAAAWRAKHPIERCPADARSLIEACVEALPDVARLVLLTPYRAFGTRPLTQLIDVQRVAPAALERLARDAGSAAYTSTYWTWDESIRLLALTAYRAGEGDGRLRDALQQQEAWMMRLGMHRAA